MRGKSPDILLMILFGILERYSSLTVSSGLRLLESIAWDRTP